MSLTKRIIDLARSNLNKLLEQAAATADPRRRLSQVSDEELEAELSRRRAAKQAEAKVDEAKARIDGGSGERRSAGLPKDREARERMAREREARVKAERTARQQQQRQSTPPPRQPPPRSGGTGSSAPPPRSGATAGQNQDLARYYARLEIPYGSGFDEVKTAYRRLMRKYHPDLHAGKSPDKVKAANEVAAALTQAYNELEKHLKGGPNRSS